MSKNDDISDLISDAETQLQTSDEKISHIKPRRHRKIRPGLIIPFLLFGLAYYIYSGNRVEVPDNLVIANELTELVREAKRLVDANTVDEIFPPVLPNAALGAIVRYEIVGKSYIISTSMNGVFVEINEAGELVVSGVVR